MAIHSRYNLTKAPKRPRFGEPAQATDTLRDRPRVVTGVGQYSPLDAFKQRRPPTSVDLVLAYRQFTFWCCNTVAAAVAQVPHRLYSIQRRGEKAGRFRTKAIDRRQFDNLTANPNVQKKLASAEKIEEVTKHPYLDLIHHVNPWMTTFQLFELMILYLETVGANFWTFVRGFGGLPVEIWPLPAWLVYVQPDYSGTDVVRQYILTAGAGQRTFAPSEVLYFRRMSLFDPYTQPFAPLRAAYEYTQIQDKLAELDDSKLSNWSRPDAVLMPTEDGPISYEETQRINSWFRQEFAMAQAGGLWVAPGGMDLKPYPWPPFDPAAEEKGKQVRYNIARCFDIPPAMVDSTGTSRANLDATLLEFARRAVLPRCRRIEEELNSNLLPLYDDRLFVAFDTAVPADQVLERETHKAYLGMGVMSINEVRLEKGLPPVKGGDELMVSNSLVTLAQAVAPPEPVIPGRVEGDEPDEVPSETETAQNSASGEVGQDVEEQKDDDEKEHDEPFKDGDDNEGDEEPKASKELDISDEAVAKALRIIDWVDRQISVEPIGEPTY